MAKTYFKSFYFTRQREGGEGEQKVSRKYFLLSIFLLPIKKKSFLKSSFTRIFHLVLIDKFGGWFCYYLGRTSYLKA